MTDAQFDPGGFYEFDLAHGAVRARGGSRVLILSENVLGPLITTAVSHGDLTAVRSLGTQLGTMISRSLKQPAPSLPTRLVVGHAASVMSLYGWGRLEMEQWGAALVINVDGLPPLDEDNLAVAALLGGMFSTLCGQEVACVPIARTTRYLMGEPVIAEPVWAWSKGGENLGTIVGRLEPGEDA